MSKRLMLKGLAERGLTVADATVHVTPRRLALLIEDLPAASAAVAEELKGPRTSAPPAALDGFLKKTGLTKDQLAVQADPKGDFYIAKIEKDGRPAPALIAEAVVETIRAFPWPKSMKWEASGLQWVRPLRSILCLFDGAIVPVEIAGLTASNVTRGHRQMANEPFQVSDFADYEMKLRERRVILDRAERMQIIDEQAERAAADAGLAFLDDDELLEEVAGLVEYPVVLTGAFDPAFLEVPQEVLIGTMRKNQKYFALTESHPSPSGEGGSRSETGGAAQAGKLAAKFLIVSNLEARDGGKAIIAGNERVLRARLSDAKFFWDNDKAVTLADRLPKLDHIVFHAKLGTQSDRVKRIERLAGEIAEKIGANAEHAKLAARLAKADLVSGTVGEFPEVQGTIGGYLARHEGLPDDVADAIANHYRPQGPTDSVPTNKVAIAVALADKLDTLVGFFAIDEKPTGSKDPFALRRAALGVVRIILENELRLGRRDLFDETFGEKILWPHWHSIVADYAGSDPELVSARDALTNGGSKASAASDIAALAEEIHLAGRATLKPPSKPSPGWARSWRTAQEVGDFLADRLKVALREKGSRHDLIDAIATSQHGEDDLVRLVRRVEALQAFLATEDGKNLLAGTKRAANILRIEEKKDGATYAADVNASLLTAPEEKALATAIDAVLPRIEAAIGKEDFASAMTALAALRAPVDAFFDKVKVNDDDRSVRANRLNLLARIKQAAGLVADFSKIEG
ncbi:MAG: glycine--tRNA ligase subunit beta [Micropepsaceae bacterium]